MLRVSLANRNAPALRVRGRREMAGFLARLAEAAGLGARWRDAGARLQVVCVGSRRMAAMNGRFLSHEGPTDVLAFDLSGGAGVPGEPRTAGEIYVCPEVAATAAVRYGTTPAHELLLYMAHGMLHLAGEDDHSPEGRRRMRRLEKRIMAAALDGRAAEELVLVAPAAGPDLKTAGTTRAKGRTA